MRTGKDGSIGCLSEPLSPLAALLASPMAPLRSPPSVHSCWTCDEASLLRTAEPHPLLSTSPHTPMVPPYPL
eukprot:755786-Hanusia_phi.AAC.1